jgi:hypothetical protein
MRLFFLFTLQILFFFPLFSQGTDTLADYPMIAYWNKNEVFNYELINGNKKIVSGIVKDSTSSASKMTLTIIDSTDKKYLIEIAYDSDRFGQDLGLTSKEAVQAINKFKAQRFKYETSEMGEFRDFKDLAKVKNFTKEILKLMEKDERYKSISKENFDNLKTKMLSDEYIASKSFEEILLMHAFHGQTWYVDTLVEFEDQLPSMLDNSKTYAANSTFIFQYDDENPEIGYIFYNTEANDGALDDPIKNYWLLRMGLDGKKITDKDRAQVKMKTTNTYVVEISTGTILSFYREQIVGNDSTENVRFLEINLKN